jgi:hypothetical protein
MIVELLRTKTSREADDLSVFFGGNKEVIAWNLAELS